MKANVYVLAETRGNSFDVYMACGTQDEAIAYYREVTGRPGVISSREPRDSGEGVLENLVLDADREGAGYVLHYVVGVSEFHE